MNRVRNHILVLLSSALAMLALFALRPSPAMADPPDIEIIEVEMGGSGCPMGTAHAVLSADKRTLSIIFDQYYGEDDEYVSCNIAISLSVPAGFTVALIEIDYRGYASIPDEDGSKGRFRAEYFFAGFTGPVKIKNFPRGYEGSFMLEHDILGAVWAPCGADVIARANTSIKTWGDDSFVAIDTADVYAGIEFHLEWDEC